VFDVLVHLIEHRDRVVSKHELLDEIWGDRFVSESALATRLRAVRKAIGDDGTAQRIIRTVFGRGYQFIAPVQVGVATPVEERPTAPPADTPVTQTIRLCTTSDGTRLAYATVGDGPVLVKAANWMTHVDIDAESPVWRHWIEGLSHGRRLVRYDERGCGLSDWDVDRFGFDDWVDDLEVVVDELGLDRFPLLGVSQGAAVAVAFAARFPHRVERLVLVGSYPQGRLARATSDDQRREAALDLEIARVGWGRDDPSFRQVFTAQFLPDGTREEWDRFDELQRHTVSPANAVRFLETFAQIDVTAVAPLVQCPTLVVHSRDDHRQPVSSGREMAALIPDSRFLALPSRNHLLTAHEPAWPLFVNEVNRFLTSPS
jgi:pimeloyl-ACP methyl ester carboxylesterase